MVYRFSHHCLFYTPEIKRTEKQSKTENFRKRPQKLVIETSKIISDGTDNIKTSQANFYETEQTHRTIARWRGERWRG